jgi:hypothetical protein
MIRRYKQLHHIVINQ